MYNKELIHGDCSTEPLRSELLVGCEQSLASRFRVTLQVTCRTATNSKAFSCNVIVCKCTQSKNENLTDSKSKGRKLFEAKTIVRLPIENRNKKPKIEKKKPKMVMQRENTRSQTINFTRNPETTAWEINWTIINQCTRNFSSWSGKKLPCANLDDGIPFLLRSTRTFSPTCL